MTRKDRTLNLPGFTVQYVSAKNPLMVHINYRRVARCPHCQSKNLQKEASFLDKLPNTA